MQADPTRADVRPWPARRWPVAVAASVAVGVAVRAMYVLTILRNTAPGLDAVWHVLQGGAIGSGNGFVVPRSLFLDDQVATAAFPPLYPAYQAVWQAGFGAGPTSVRLAGLVPAVASIWLVALLGRRLAGPAVGVGAALLVALHPGLIASDGSTMSESLTPPLVLASLLLAVVVADLEAGPRRTFAAVGLGAVLGLAVLTRQDLGVIAVLLGPWLLWRIRPTWREGAALAAAVAVAGLALIGPWTLRNHRALDVASLSTLSPTSALAGANCDSTYGGVNLGSWDYACVDAARPSGVSEDDLATGGVSEAELMAAYRHAGTAYARSRPARLPVVVAARTARVWSLWDPADLARRDTDESRRFGWQVVARPIDALISVAGATAIVSIWRRRRVGSEGASPSEVWVLAVPFLTVAVSAAIGYGNPRFNAIAQPAAAVAIAWWGHRAWTTRRLVGGADASNR